MLYGVSTELMDKIENARWVPQGNIHLTLKFLGSTPDEKLDDIENAIREAVHGFRKFFFSLGDIGAFPSHRRARVVWIGVHHGASELVELSQTIEKALIPLGFESENKEFKPHITLARIKAPKSIEAVLSEFQDDIFTGRIVNVDGITIFRSTLKRTGAEYESLRYVPLSG